ncbi:MAG TPA: ATP-binding protein [Actinospica sp.]|nr:ATP-binding protein [Actinospica sp.]
MNGAAHQPVPGRVVRSLALQDHVGSIALAREFTREVVTDSLESRAAAAAAQAGRPGREADGLDGNGPEQRQFVDDVLLMVSEVVTNACVHTDGPLGLEVDCAPDRLRIEVTDPSRTVPVPRNPDPSTPGGFGLFVVERLAKAWGHAPRGDGKVVWLELEWPKPAPSLGESAT